MLNHSFKHKYSTKDSRYRFPPKENSTDASISHLYQGKTKSFIGESTTIFLTVTDFRKISKLLSNIEIFSYFH